MERSKGKRRESSVEKSETKRSRVRSRSNSLEEDRVVPTDTDAKNVSRKTRWQDKTIESKEVTQSSDNKGSTQISSEWILRDHLHDKVAIVERLFQIPSAKLESYKSDYLKKYTNSQLKRLCYRQLKMMSNESILEIIEAKRKELSEANKTELDADGKGDNRSSVKIKEEVGKSTIATNEDNTESLPFTSSSHSSDSSSRDVLELYATSNEMEDLIEDENKKVDNKQTDEESKLQNDAELLELEMRARAIRSLLKAKSLSNAENDDEDKQEGKDDTDEQETKDDEDRKKRPG